MYLPSLNKDDDDDIYISVNSWYLNKPDEDWYWPVEISQLNSISRWCDVSLQKSSRTVKFSIWYILTVTIFLDPTLSKIDRTRFLQWFFFTLIFHEDDDDNQWRIQPGGASCQLIFGRNWGRKGWTLFMEGRAPPYLKILRSGWPATPPPPLHQSK